MQSEKNGPEETVEELCKRAVAEQDLEKLLKLLIKIQQSTEGSTVAEETADGMTGRAAQSESLNS